MQQPNYLETLEITLRLPHFSVQVFIIMTLKKCLLEPPKPPHDLELNISEPTNKIKKDTT